MCSYVSDCTLEPIDSETILRIFNEHLSRHPIAEEEKISVKLFASGSFLNPYELPKDARDEILKTLMNLVTLQKSLLNQGLNMLGKKFLMKFLK